MVARIEWGECRVDLVEAYELFKALKFDPVRETAELMKRFAEAR